MTAKKFWAKRSTRSLAFSTGSGLSASFSRGSGGGGGFSTIDPDGTSVTGTQLRFDRAVRIASISGTTLVHSSSNCAVLASGLPTNDAGTPPNPYLPLMVYLDTAGNVSKTGTITAGLGTASQYNSTTLTERNASGGAQDGGAPDKLLDIFSTSTPEKAYHPVDAVIVHGLIILACTVYLKNGDGDYDIGGTGFVTSQDKGVTWTPEWDDTGDIAQSNVIRGATWMITANPVYGGRTDLPTAVVITCSNYINKGYDPAASAGRVFVFRCTRSSTTSPWVCGTPKYFDAAVPVTHAHSAWATEWSNPTLSPAKNGLQVIASYGDNQNRNRLIRYLLDDITSTFSSATWTTIDSYHGRKSDDSNPDEGTPSGESTESMQPVGNLFTPTPGATLLGGDQQMEWITCMRVPTEDSPNDDATDRQAYFEHIYGWSTNFNHRDLNEAGCRHAAGIFNMNQPRPELSDSRPALAVVNDGATDSDQNLCRLLYTPGIDLDTTKDTWVQVGVARGDSSRVTACLYGTVWDKVYFTQFPGSGSTGLFVRSLSTILEYRPALVAPGGVNLVIEPHGSANDGFYISVEGSATIHKLTRSTYTDSFVDDTVSPSVTLPKPPSMATVMWIITTSRSDSTTHYDKVTLWPSVLPTGTPPTQHSPCNWVNDPNAPQVRRSRLCLMDASFAQVDPNKTLQLAAKQVDLLTTTPGNPGLYSCKNAWAQMTQFAQRVLGQSTSDQRSIGYVLFPSYGGGDGPDDNRYYFLVDQMQDGNGSLGYPQRPQDSAAGSAVTGPDELLSITASSLVSGSNHWLIRVVLMMPIGNWDQYADRYTGNTSTKVWPLFCIVRLDGGGAIDRSIAILADCENKRFIMRTFDGSATIDTPIGTSGEQVWVSDSPIMVAIGFNKTSGSETLYASASLGGDTTQVSSGVSASWLTSVTFSELRFRGTDDEVAEVRVLAGEINDAATAPTSTNMASTFSSLSFLSNGTAVPLPDEV